MFKMKVNVINVVSLLILASLAACGGGGGSAGGSSSAASSLGSVNTPQNFVLPSAVSTVPPQ
jgi:hypothetical protein